MILNKYYSSELDTSFWILILFQVVFYPVVLFTVLRSLLYAYGNNAPSAYIYINSIHRYQTNTNGIF